MRSNLKKIVLYIFLAELMALPILYSSGSLVYLFEQKVKNRINVSESEKVTDVITVLKTTSGGLIDKHLLLEDEITLNGEQYDIIKVEEKGNKLILYCYHDRREERLNAEIAKMSVDINDVPLQKEKAPVKPILPFWFVEDRNTIQVDFSTSYFQLLGKDFKQANSISYTADCFSPPEGITA